MLITIAYELCGIELQNLYLNLSVSTCGINYNYLYQFLTTLSFPKVKSNGKLGGYP